jgi:fructose-specific phosphotransferase system component IIB
MTILSFLSEFYTSNLFNLLINGANTILFIFGIVLLIRAFIYLVKISREINSFDSEFRDTNQLKEELFKESFLNKYSEKGLIRKSFKILENLSKTSIEDREKIVYLEGLSNGIRTAVPRAVPSISVVIGFFGTVIGLYMAISAMPAIFTSTDVGKSEQAFQILIDTMINSLGAMSIAFGTTLVGLAISVLLTIGNLIYRIYWDKFDKKFEELLVLKIFPAFVAPNDDSLTKILVDFASASDRTMKTIVNSNEKLLNSVNGLAGNMSQYNTNNERVLKQVISAVKNFSDLQQGNQEVYESIKSIASQAEKSYHRVEELLDTSIQDREGFLGYLQDSRNEIKEISNIQYLAYKQTNEDFLEKQKEFYEISISDLVKNQKSIFKEQLISFSDTSKKLQDQITLINNELIKNITEDNKVKVDSFIKQSTMLNIEISKQISNIEETINKNITLKTQEFVTGVKDLNQLLIAFKTDVSIGYDNYGKETRNLIKELAGLVSKSIEANKIYLGSTN